MNAKLLDRIQLYMCILISSLDGPINLMLIVIFIGCIFTKVIIKLQVYFTYIMYISAN